MKKPVTPIPWMRDLPKRCDHSDLVFGFIGGDIKLPSFAFNTWDERSYFACTRCGKKFWEGGEDGYATLYPQFIKWLNERKVS
jgi:hypothetical protein